MNPHRPRWRAYLLLARVSNLPTVWTNVLAGMAASGVLRWPTVLSISVAVSLFYVAGMFLNDAFDRDVDARLHPERPLPAGDVGAGEAVMVGGFLMAVGAVLLARAAPASALGWGAALAAAIVYYDYRHKRDPFAPVIMGLCRGLVYLVAGSMVGRVSAPVYVAGGIMAAYVVGLTWIARRLGPDQRGRVPWLIAGISLVDAVVLVWHSRPDLAGLAVIAFLLTRGLQRFVPGD